MDSIPSRSPLDAFLGSENWKSADSLWGIKIAAKGGPPTARGRKKVDILRVFKMEHQVKSYRGTGERRETVTKINSRFQICGGVREGAKPPRCRRGRAQNLFHQMRRKATNIREKGDKKKDCDWYFPKRGEKRSNHQRRPDN